MKRRRQTLIKLSQKSKRGRSSVVTTIGTHVTTQDIIHQLQEDESQKEKEMIEKEERRETKRRAHVQKIKEEGPLVELELAEDKLGDPSKLSKHNLLTLIRYRGGIATSTMSKSALLDILKEMVKEN